MTQALSDPIGSTYRSTRRSDPGIAAAIRRGLAFLRADLESGEWERRFGHLRQREAIDVCYRLLVTT